MRNKNVMFVPMTLKLSTDGEWVQFSNILKLQTQGFHILRQLKVKTRNSTTLAKNPRRQRQQTPTVKRNQFSVYGFFW